VCLSTVQKYCKSKVKGKARGLPHVFDLSLKK
jgi:hypothetical protein